MAALYFLGQRLLASGARLWWSDTQQEHTNPVFVCPTCGDSWGRVQNDPSFEWYPVRRACAKHVWLDPDTSGSFIASWRRSFAELPPEVLAYEATLRLNRYKDTP